MPGVVLLGAQWGDEGKGKITDLLSRDYDYVARFQGGNNAGHTVIVGDRKLQLHLIPSGVMYDNVTPVIGNGCVLDLKVLIDEIDRVESEGISCERLVISSNAHLIMPYHRDIDAAHERRLGENLIGTTKRGIGPAYQDKISRMGLRMQDLFDRSIFREKVAAVLIEKNDVLSKVYGLDTYTVDQIAEEYMEYAQRLKPYIDDISPLLNRALDADEWVLFEGAQGTLLDVDHGTYPFVTSSNPTAGGATVGTGVGPTRIDRVMGVAKAYITRVGSGPFPTELFDADGDTFIEVGREFGTTTGRRRRAGWYDAVITKYAAEVNGLTDLCITKLDILSEFSTIKICVAYEHLSKTYTTIPGHQSAFHHAKPVYEEMPGWNVDITGCRKYEDLPIEARNYIDRLEELAGVPVTMIAVGPDRKQTIHRGFLQRSR
ncbi:MAG: adenylosuccinate synthase [Coriobacteriia bacterium]|nr:adenylosuccinate synthase [Coriobacteriia bacterium]